MPRLADDDPRKWTYTEHARAKHAILTRYLDAWLSILGALHRGRRHQRLLIVDGFAGRARYETGEPGSPLLIHDAAARAIERGIASRVVLLCSEANEANFAELERACSELDHEGVEVITRHGLFAERIERLTRWLAQTRPIPPSFVFADPFGFTGVPLEAIRSVMAIPYAEILLTFMARDMARFLELPNVGPTLTEFFGDQRWRGCVDAPIGGRPECLLLTYKALVESEGIAEHATPFRVFEDEKRQPLYYLLHLTNHPLGMRRMREAMIRESPEMTFWPITVRPPGALELDVSEPPPYESLQRHLVETYVGRKLTFEQLLNADYPSGLWVEKHYRAAVAALEAAKPPKVWILRARTTPSGAAPRGVQLPDVIKFYDDTAASSEGISS